MVGPQDASALVRSFEQLFPLTPPERVHLDVLTANAEEIEPNRKLISEGKASDQIFIMKAGWVVEWKVLRNGGRQILNFRLAGDIVGAECLAYGAALSSTAALTRCTIARVPIKVFEQTQREFPRLAAALFLMTMREGAVLHEWEVNLGRRSALPRVAHLLFELNRRLRIRGLAHDHSVPFPLTQQDIADCTGLTTPYVNRILQKLRSEDLIQVSDKALTIQNPAELAKAGGFTGDYLDKWGQGWSSLTSERDALAG